MSDPDIQRRMREDWDRRAREDARYYVAFGRRQQTAEEFFATAGEVLHAIRIELRRFPPTSDTRSLSALEIGCGPGRLLVPLSKVFGSIVGVDVSPEMIEMARANLAGIPNARAELVSGSDLGGLDDQSFDFCYSYAVFQHIPSREVVLNYLREARRVLKTGGILKCQFSGLPDAGPGEADTWSGVRFRPEEIRDFCRTHDWQLLLLDGVDTQNLWVAARKQPSGWSATLGPRPGARLLKVTNAYATDSVVPAAGRFSCASLWIEDLCAGADINNLTVEFAGRRVIPSYVGRYTWKGPSQVNAFLPPGTPTGPIPVRLWMLDQPISNFTRLRVIPAPRPLPRLLTLTDGINLLSGTRIENRLLKVDLDEVGPAPVVAAEIDGVALEDQDLFCIDPLSHRYAVNLKVPPEIPPGPHAVTIRLHGRAFAPVAIDIVE